MDWAIVSAVSCGKADSSVASALTDRVSVSVRCFKCCNIGSCRSDHQSFYSTALWRDMARAGHVTVRRRSTDTKLTVEVDACKISVDCSQSNIYNKIKRRSPSETAKRNEAVSEVEAEMMAGVRQGPALQRAETEHVPDVRRSTAGEPLMETE